MGSFLTAGAFTPGTAGAVSTAGPFPAGLVAGDRIYVAISSGAANPNTITDPAALGGTTWVKLDEFAPTSTFKTALYYVDITAGNAAAWSSSSHTWTWQTSARCTAVWEIIRDVDQSRAPSFARAQGVENSTTPTPVPGLTPGTYDWAGFVALGRQSPGTDPAKTWQIAGFTSDVERADSYATNTGTGQKLSVALYDTAGPSSASVPSGGGGTTVSVTDARPVNTWNSIALNAPTGVRIGATLDASTVDTWKPRLLKNQFMRIFPNSATKLPPSWTDPRIVYCQQVGAYPFLSSKCDGDATKIQGLYDYFAAMPTSIINDPNVLVYFTEHHEPEKEYVAANGNTIAGGAAAYIADYKAVWNKLATLPAPIRAKIKMGPALTKQWTEVASKGNFNYQNFDPGVLFREFKGYDVYVDSGSLATSGSVYPVPATFLQYIKADNAGGQLKLMVEFGAINKIGDDDGSGRAAWLQACYDEMRAWADFGGMIWWNDHGTPSTASIAGIGTERYFELDLRYAAENTPADLPKVTTTITYGGGGGGGARTIAPNLAQSNVHLWAYTVPMVTPAPPVAGNVWSTMGLPIK